MIIKAIVLPTPMRIKKKLKKIKLEKDEIFLYSLIGGGIILISFAKIDNKALPIFGLGYCGVSYTFLKNVDDEILNEILKEYNHFYRI